ncbi:MAG: DUF6080 domain-containing protein [Planctomycetota bacterium]
MASSELGDGVHNESPKEHGRARGRGADVALVVVLGIAAAIGSYWGSVGLDELLVLGTNADVWFEADCPRVFENLTDPLSVQSRAAVHPLSTLCLYPPTWLLRQVCGFEPIVALRCLRSLIVTACVVAFYVLLRILGLRRIDSLLATILVGVSAAGMFWFVVPETYPPGLLTILLAIGLTAFSQSRRVGPVWDVLVNLATLSFTITNWMAGLAATLVCRPWRRALVLLLIASCLLLALMAVQHEFFPSAARWPVSSEETTYLLHADAGGPSRAALSFLSHSMVMPAIETVPRYGREVLSVQHAWPGSSGAWGIAAVLLWAVLLVVGIYGCCTSGRYSRVRLVLGLTIAGQLVLHMFYGLETFLYCGHFAPLLVLLVAFGLLSPACRVVRILMVALIVCAAVNNAGQFAKARRHVIEHNRSAIAPVVMPVGADAGTMAA